MAFVGGHNIGMTDVSIPKWRYTFYKRKWDHDEGDIEISISTVPLNDLQRGHGETVGPELWHVNLRFNRWFRSPRAIQALDFNFRSLSQNSTPRARPGADSCPGRLLLWTGENYSTAILGHYTMHATMEKMIQPVWHGIRQTDAVKSIETEPSTVQFAREKLSQLKLLLESVVENWNCQKL